MQNEIQLQHTQFYDTKCPLKEGQIMYIQYSGQDYCAKRNSTSASTVLRLNAHLKKDNVHVYLIVRDVVQNEI